MEKISDFFKDIKERLSSPFISSFIVAWIFINWKIVIGLLRYDIKELAIDGYSSFIDLINTELNTSNSLIYPISLAIGYTFLYPFLRNLILAFNFWMKTWGNRWNLKISKTGKVSLEKYIQLRNVYKERTLILEQVLEKESTYLEENERLKNETFELQRQKNEIESSLLKWKNFNDIRILDGDWEYSYTSTITEQEIKSKINIYDGIFSEYINSVRDKRRLYNIESFHFNPQTNELVFALIPAKGSDPSNRKDLIQFQTLQMFDGLTFLRGHSNKNLEIQYRRTTNELHHPIYGVSVENGENNNKKNY